MNVHFFTANSEAKSLKFGVIIDIFVHIGILLFLCSFFRLEYLSSETTATGGDTGSHYYTLQYLHDVLLPQGKISGWTMGNYAGFPILLFYFPFPFLAMTALSCLIPLQAAFKVVTVWGIFTLPLAVYTVLRLLRQPFPIPISGALFSLFFLFMEANSVWGGNIMSTLAGEFSYSIGLSFAILFVGTLHRGITMGKYVILNGVLVFFIGFCHGYTLLFAGFVSSFFLFDRRRVLKNCIYLIKIHGLAFMLLGFWLIPLIGGTAWTTALPDRWFVASFLEIIPPILWPCAILTILGAIARATGVMLRKRRKPASSERLFTSPQPDGGAARNEPTPKLETCLYLLYGMVVAWLLFLAGPTIGVIDIRFVPFFQVYIVITGAVGLGILTAPLRGKGLVPVILFLLVVFTVTQLEKNIHAWINWNYRGFENKPLWKPFIETNHYLSGSVADPRVIFEHSDIHNGAGSIRAFESLPLFSGRNTLEGLYLQSSLSSPFIFYIQSEMSKQSSRPLPHYRCTNVDIAAGMEHLKLFNVRDFIVASDEIREKLHAFPEFIREKDVRPYSIYRLSSNENRYVVPLAYAPVWNDRDGWKTRSYEWFRTYMKHPGVHVVFDDDPPPAKAPVVQGVRYETGTTLPRVPIEEQPIVTEKIENEEISITTTKPGIPLLIKVSYHPGWRVEGADKIYLASPSFMLIYPKAREVRLYYGHTLWTCIGFLFTALGLASIGFGLFLAGGSRSAEALRVRINATSFAARLRTLAGALEARNTLTGGIVTFIFVIIAAHIILSAQNDPLRLCNKAMSLRDDQSFQEARHIYQRIISDHPGFSKVDEAYYYLAICFYKEKNWQKNH